MHAALRRFMPRMPTCLRRRKAVKNQGTNSFSFHESKSPARLAAALGAAVMASDKLNVVAVCHALDGRPPAKAEGLDSPAAVESMPLIPARVILSETINEAVRVSLTAVLDPSG